MKYNEDMMEREEVPSTVFDNELDLAKFLGSVHSTIQDSVSADYVLSKPDDKTKEYMTEMVNNAYYANNIMNRLIIKADNIKGQYERARPMDKKMTNKLTKDIELLKKYRDQVIVSFTSKSQILAVMNRNNDQNFLAKLLGKMREEERIEEMNKPMQEQVKDKLRPEVQQ